MFSSVVPPIPGTWVRAFPFDNGRDIAFFGFCVTFGDSNDHVWEVCKGECSCLLMSGVCHCHRSKLGRNGVDQSSKRDRRRTCT